MTFAPDTGLARTILEAGWPVRPKRAVVGVSLGLGSVALWAPRLWAPRLGTMAGLDQCLGGVRGALTIARGSRRRG
jgi:hypothetical protein